MLPKTEKELKEYIEALEFHNENLLAVVEYQKTGIQICNMKPPALQSE